jgi:import inner membrane translocase subunit TIM21
MGVSKGSEKSWVGADTLSICQGGVFYLLYTDVISPNSRTWQYEKAVERVKDDPRCIQLLGDRREIRAFGETTNSRWARNRPVA